jgi:hypothetical protein
MKTYDGRASLDNLAHSSGALHGELSVMLASGTCTVVAGTEV